MHKMSSVLGFYVPGWIEVGELLRKIKVMIDSDIGLRPDPDADPEMM